MRFRHSPNFPLYPHCLRFCHHHHHHHQRRLSFTSFLKKYRSTSQVRFSFNGTNNNNGSSSSEGGAFFLPGATVATILMLGVLHARRLYEDKKMEDAREKGIELEFHPDIKARFLEIIPLRTISRLWGTLTNVEIPVSLRPYVYRAWARAFHSNLEEAALPLEEYASLREFFVRKLKEDVRPIDTDPCCLVSPVDGTILRCGELKGSGTMIEQVKGFSYSVASLLGAGSFISMIAEGDMPEESNEQQSNLTEKSKKSWWRILLASSKVRDTVSPCPGRGLYYCVIYLKPGDYHRIHSPTDWNVLVRRHFSGRLFPMNDRARRTIRNLYIENERVVLEGIWKEGFMVIVAVGATNIGSIEVFIEPELCTNQPRKNLLRSEPPKEWVYEPQGVGKMLKKGDEVGAFNMGSTVVLVFQGPVSEEGEIRSSSSQFKFNIKRGDKIRFGEALGRWGDQ